MQIKAFTTSSMQMVTAIDKAMNEGGLKTWKIVKADHGKIFYTHTPEQWNEKALIAREANQDSVVFTITYWQGKPKPSMDDEGYYFGRFTEILLVHFRNYFSKLEVFV
jgi:hypothetical protein